MPFWQNRLHASICAIFGHGIFRPGMSALPSALIPVVDSDASVTSSISGMNFRVPDQTRSRSSKTFDNWSDMINSFNASPFGTLADKRSLSPRERSRVCYGNRFSLMMVKSFSNNLSNRVLMFQEKRRRFHCRSQSPSIVRPAIIPLD